MKNTILIFFAIAIVIGCSNKPNEKNIEVEGFASIKVDPDIVRVSIVSVAQDMVYSKAATDVNSNTDKLVNMLKSNGFTNLKSVSFSVDKITDYRDQSEDKGYMARQVILLEFPVNKESINKAINLLSGKSISSEFNFSFELSDKKKTEAERKLVSEAVTNAKTKMELLSQTGDFATGRILKVNYHGKEQFYPSDRVFNFAVEEERSNQFSGLDISQVELSDNVLVVWEIK